MNVKGTAYLTRKDTIIKAFGEQRWNSFNAKLTEKDKFFGNMIMNALEACAEDESVRFGCRMPTLIAEASFVTADALLKDDG